MYDISIVLVNYRNKMLTEDCINSILNSNCKVSFEIIVVDNHSKDGSIEYLQEKFPNIIISDSGRNLGFAFGNNIGVRMAIGKYVLLLNNDTKIYKNMLDDLYETAEKNPKIGLLGCRAIDCYGVELPITHSYENLSTIRLQSYIKPILEKMKLQRRLISIIKKKNTLNKEIIFTDWIAGSAMFINRKLYNDIGGLDENFFMYMEDEDFSHRINDAGYLVGVSNTIGYIHYCGGSTIQSYFLTKEYFKSRLLFFRRYNNNNFTSIKKALYAQIKVVNNNLSKNQLEKMKSELDLYIEIELEKKAKYIKGIKE
ncbi:glycosyltransferase family 2 protein [Thomasclavelia cocleata]|uniref:glycosyltransferase family 2 protein n=1 Tax=Thomasclavelia cocleata TaxID=69824 RepID=UPI0025581412|nr:glycosyltransferase [Thomasclavelia cocleata]